MVWNFSDPAWEEGYRHAKEYFDIHGNLNIRIGYVCSDGFKLFAWIQNKRTAYKNAKLSPERIVQLEKLGMKCDGEGKKAAKLSGNRPFLRD